MGEEETVLAVKRTPRKMEMPAEPRCLARGVESLADWMTDEEVLVSLQALSDVFEAQETGR